MRSVDPKDDVQSESKLEQSQNNLDSGMKIYKKNQNIYESMKYH